MTVEELQVIVTARTKGLEQQMQALTSRLQGVQRQTNTMSTNMTRTFANLKRTLVGLGIGKAIQGMFNLSRTYEAATQQVNRIFRENANAIEAWIGKNALTFGMARADAMEYASIYGNLVKGFEKDTKKMSQYTTELLEATTVIASNTGRTVKDVSERIRSGILGNTEAIEDLGIYAQVAMIKTSNAFKTVANGRTWDALTFQEQQQIRVMSILEQSATQFGTSIQKNTNYQLMQLTANLKNVALNLGNAFMPIVSVVLPVLNSMALALANVTNKLASFMNALFGTNFNTGAGQVQQVATGASDAASGYEDMSNAADDAGESAKKAGKAAKNALLGFDEINSLSKDSGSESDGGSGGVGASGTGVATSTVISEATESFADKVQSTMDRLKNLLKEGFEIGLGDGWQAQVDDIQKSIQGIKDSLKDIFTDSEVRSSFKNFVDSMTVSIGKEIGSMVSIGTTMAQNLLGGIDKYLEQNKQYIKDRIVGTLDAVAEIELLVADYRVAFADIFSAFGGEAGQEITSNIIGIFSNGFLGILELATDLGRDIIKCIAQPIIDNKESIKQALEGSLEVISVVTGTLKDLITDTMQKALEVYDEYLAPAFEKVEDGISQIVKSLIDAYNSYIQPTLMKMAKSWESFYTDSLKPVVDKALEVFGKLVDGVAEIWNKTLAPFVAWAIDVLSPHFATAFENISEAFKIAGEIILDVVNGLLDIFSGLIDFVVGVFTGDWKKAWEGIKTIFKGIVDTFKAIALEPLEKILTYVKDTFIRTWKTNCDTFSRAWSGAWETMKTGTKNSINWIIDKINGMINGINSKLRFELPEIMGGAKIGFSIPNIPRLARGGIVDGATFMGNYIAGEAGKEMVVPLENTSFTDKIATAMGQAVMNAMSIMLNSGGMTGSNGQPIILQTEGGTVIARGLAPYMIKEFERLGIDLD